MKSQPFSSQIPEVTVVLPCLNEADTLPRCLEKCFLSLRSHQIEHEIIVADNGSTDGSPTLAASFGARVIHVAEKGYGNALMGGISAARGRYVVMGDADDSYDFLETHKFVDELRKGFDLVQGCRLPSGGGTIAPGAMPFLHRWLGNPIFTMLARLWFRSRVHDVYCGLRGFTKDFYMKLDPRCTGMEFAIEMIIKAHLLEARISEIPITLHVDGRISHPPHLKTFRDGWRTLRFLLLYSPRWLFLLPGSALVALGLAGYAVAMPKLTVLGITFDAHTLLFATLFILCGYQAILFALIAKTFAIRERLLPEDRFMTRLFALLTLERCLIVGSGALLLGVVLLAWAVARWIETNFGNLEYSQTMRLVIPGATLTALGFQTILSSFLASLLGMHRR